MKRGKNVNGDGVSFIKIAKDVHRTVNYVRIMFLCACVQQRIYEHCTKNEWMLLAVIWNADEKIEKKERKCKRPNRTNNDR